MKKCLRWIVSTVLFVCLVLSNANADPVSSVSGSDVNIDATKGVSICAGTGDVRIATDCTGGGTQSTWVFDNATGIFSGNISPTTSTITSTTSSLTLTTSSDANRKWTFSNTSDTALFLTCGDNTAGQTCKYLTGTTDGADNSRWWVGIGAAGGGSNRGAYMYGAGNEDTETGDLVLGSGSLATSDIWMFTPTGGTINYQSDTQYMRTTAGTIGVSFGVSGTTSNIRGGATSLQFNNYANTFANLTIVDDGDTTINRGSLIFGAALSTIRAGATSIQFNNAANSVANLTIADAGPITIRNTLVSSDTGTLGWSVVNAANQACTTTCTSACVFGMNTGALGNFVGCADATADTCVCAGAS